VRGDVCSDGAQPVGPPQVSVVPQLTTNVSDGENGTVGGRVTHPSLPASQLRTDKPGLKNHPRGCPARFFLELAEKCVLKKVPQGQDSSRKVFALKWRKSYWAEKFVLNDLPPGQSAPARF
jgi:hypothetical protein